MSNHRAPIDFSTDSIIHNVASVGNKETTADSKVTNVLCIGMNPLSNHNSGCFGGLYGTVAMHSIARVINYMSLLYRQPEFSQNCRQKLPLVELTISDNSKNRFTDFNFNIAVSEYEANDPRAPEVVNILTWQILALLRDLVTPPTVTCWNGDMNARPKLAGRWCKLDLEQAGEVTILTTEQRMIINQQTKGITDVGELDEIMTKYLLIPAVRPLEYYCDEAILSQLRFGLDAKCVIAGTALEKLCGYGITITRNTTDQIPIWPNNNLNSSIPGNLNPMCTPYWPFSNPGFNSIDLTTDRNEMMYHSFDGSINFGKFFGLM